MKTLKYLRYILIHKYWVLRYCFKYGLIWRGLVHDLSKLLPSEFVPYRENFYGDLKHTDETLTAFEYAWNSHQKRQTNSHHWQYWVLLCDDGKCIALDMPLKDCCELVSDWRGASMAIKGFDNTLNWYKQNKKNMILHPNTRKWIENEIGYEKEIVYAEKT